MPGAVRAGSIASRHERTSFVDFAADRPGSRCDSRGAGRPPGARRERHGVRGRRQRTEDLVHVAVCQERLHLHLGRRSDIHGGGGHRLFADEPGARAGRRRVLRDRCPLSTGCTPQPGNVCCRSESGNSCSCNQPKCASPDVQVSECNLQTVLTGAKACPPIDKASTQSVAQCFPAVETPSSPNTSSGDSGGGGSCSPKSGSCDNASDCACGQSCFATSVCSTCTKGCHYSCKTDQDCIDVSKNLTHKYTNCKKYSPSFEIYLCE